MARISQKQLAKAVGRACNASTFAQAEPGDAKATGETPSSATGRIGAVWTLEVPGWVPTRLNKLLGSHWAAAGRLKDKDANVLATAVMVYGVPKAEGKRRVRLHIVFPKGERAADKDAYHKSLLDGLVKCGAIRNDSHVWVEWEPPTYSRGDAKVTYVTLEDV
jgi:hypothetical protein